MGFHCIIISEVVVRQGSIIGVAIVKATCLYKIQVLSCSVMTYQKLLSLVGFTKLVRQPTKSLSVTKLIKTGSKLSF